VFCVKLPLLRAADRMLRRQGALRSQQRAKHVSSK
jgi:hypothetical protein